MAMGLLGSGLYAADHHEDALPVREAEVKHAAVAGHMQAWETLDGEVSIERDVYSGHSGEEHDLFSRSKTAKKPRHCENGWRGAFSGRMMNSR